MATPKKPKQPNGKERPRGRPFQRGFDKRRNLRGPVPELSAIREAIRRDGLRYVDQLFRLAMNGDITAVRVAIEQMLGRPPASIVLTGPDGGPVQVQDARTKLAERIAALVEARRAREAAAEPK